MDAMDFKSEVTHLKALFEEIDALAENRGPLVSWATIYAEAQELSQRGIARAAEILRRLGGQHDTPEDSQNGQPASAAVD